MSALLRRTSPAMRQTLLPPRQLLRPFHRAQTYSSKTGPHSTGKGEEPPQLPKFSLDSLGATPTIKAVIYTAIGIIGTVETYTYGIWIYHNVYPRPVMEDRKGLEGADD